MDYMEKKRIAKALGDVWGPISEVLGSLRKTNESIFAGDPKARVMLREIIEMCREIGTAADALESLLENLDRRG